MLSASTGVFAKKLVWNDEEHQVSREVKQCHLPLARFARSIARSTAHRAIHQSNSPCFNSEVQSVFLNFIEGADTRLKTCLEELKTISYEDLIGEDIKATLEAESINVSDPLSSTTPLADIMEVILTAPSHCSNRQLLDKLLHLQREFADWVSSHEIHVLLGALRLPSHASSFMFSICDPDMDFLSWNDFASESTLFGVILKAVWLRCILGTQLCSVGGNASDAQSLRSKIVIDGAGPSVGAGAGPSAGDGLEMFKNHFIDTHYSPVFIPFAAFSH